MTPDLENNTPHLILAAGGLLLGVGDNSGKIAVVRRRRYLGEIALPKGKVKAGEGEIDAAQREVREETGCDVKVNGYAGTTRYFVGSAPKIIFYFVMEVDGSDQRGPADTAEIESVEWLTPARAVGVLTHAEDRELVAAVFGIARSAEEWRSMCRPDQR